MTEFIVLVLLIVTAGLLTGLFGWALLGRLVRGPVALAMGIAGALCLALAFWGDGFSLELRRWLAWPIAQLLVAAAGGWAIGARLLSTRA